MKKVKVARHKKKMVKRTPLSIAARKPGRSGPTKQDPLGRFGPYLKKRRNKQRLAIRELAKLAKMPHTNIFQFERLGKNPRLTELVALANAFKEPLLKFIAPLQRAATG